jgi:hypothetical protein
LRHLPSARPCPRSATARRNRPRALLFSPAPRPPAQPSPSPSRAAMPPRVPARTPKSPRCRRPQALEPPPIKTLAAAALTLATSTPVSFPPPPHPGEVRGEEGKKEKGRARRRRTPPGAARGAGRRHVGASPSRRPDRLHQRCGSSCTATTRRLRPATAPAPFPFSPSGEDRCRRPSRSPVLPA